MLGEPFGMFDYLPVGAVLTAAGVAFLTVGWRLLPRTRGAAGGPEALFSVESYQAEVGLPADSLFIGRTVGELEELGEGDVGVTTIIRGGSQRHVPTTDWRLEPNDILLLRADPPALARIVSEAGLELLHHRALEGEEVADELEVVEAVITESSLMVGRSLRELRLREVYRLNILALSQGGRTLDRRMHRARFRAGDLIVLQGHASAIHERMAALGCLPLAERKLQLGRHKSWYAPAIILAVAMIAVTMGLTTVAVAFFGAAVLVVLVGALALKEAYAAVDGSVLVLLGALIPVSEALRTTGATDLLAGWLAVAAGALPPIGALGLTLLAAMAVTPFLNNAATVLVMAPIGPSLATTLKLSPDPFLMAVAVGAACDFLTPIGHQCNTLVMGPGGYRFGDYWRLGLPLSILVTVLGTLMISLVWPFQ
jgi:di/tricarboxylate transporter